MPRFSARRLARLAGALTAALFVLLIALTPIEPDACELGVLILCVELPLPGDAWAAALGAPRLELLTWLDFGFLAAYGSFLAALGVSRGGPRFAAATASAALLAAGLDGVENALLLEALARPDAASPGLVHLAASLKFTLLGALTGALALRAPRGWAGRVERLGALFALALVATPALREATLVGAPGLAVAWLAALGGLGLRDRPRTAK